MFTRKKKGRRANFLGVRVGAAQYDEPVSTSNSRERIAFDFNYWHHWPEDRYAPHVLNASAQVPYHSKYMAVFVTSRVMMNTTADDSNDDGSSTTVSQSTKTKPTTETKPTTIKSFQHLKSNNNQQGQTAMRRRQLNRKTAVTLASSTLEPSNTITAVVDIQIQFTLSKKTKNNNKNDDNNNTNTTTTTDDTNYWYSISMVMDDTISSSFTAAATNSPQKKG